jgi:sugar/nucleoside kinase (ribokinase family)
LPVRTLCDLLLKKTKTKNVILKLGQNGLISLNSNRKDYISLNPMVNQIIDTSGAGDALLAYSSATLFHTKSLILSSIMGILVASCKCEVEGNIPVTVKQINEKIDSIIKEIGEQ